MRSRPTREDRRTAVRSWSAWAVYFTAAGCAGGGEATSPLDYGVAGGTLTLRIGDSFTLSPAMAFPDGLRFTVTPALPAGLALDPDSGVVAGTPAGAAVERAVYTITAATPGDGGEALLHAELSIAISPALPPALRSLQAGFAAEVLADALPMPAKLAVSPDGRVFFTELTTGNIRVLGSDGVLAAQPFATLPVLTGGHRGLLGIALAPDFGTTSSYVFVSVCTPADGTGADRIRVVRYRDGGSGVGVDETVILDDLPVSAGINNGGALCFDATGRHLLLSVGDTEDPALAQDDGSPAGKILRMRTDGGVPADATDRVFCKGLRNTFALTVHPTTGGVFGADNGPAADDELNFLERDKNYEWGASPGASFGAQTGFEVFHWSDVVVPTGLAFGSGSGHADDRDDLFVAIYDEETILRFELSGAARTDVDRVTPYAEFEPDQNRHKPLDVQVGADGSLYVATFSAIWRFWRP